MKKCWLPGFLTSLPTEKNKNVVLWECADQIYPPFSLYAGHFFCLLDILRGSLHIVCCTHIYHHSCLSFLLLSPVIFYFSIHHTQKQTHLPLPPVTVAVCQSVRVPHSGGFGEWLTRPARLFSDTCQSLICRLCAEMEMSRNDTTCQRWRWRLTSFHQLLNQLRSSQRVLAG